MKRRIWLFTWWLLRWCLVLYQLQWRQSRAFVCLWNYSSRNEMYCCVKGKCFQKRSEVRRQSLINLSTVDFQNDFLDAVRCCTNFSDSSRYPLNYSQWNVMVALEHNKKTYSHTCDCHLGKETLRSIGSLYLVCYKYLLVLYDWNPMKMSFRHVEPLDSLWRIGTDALKALRKLISGTFHNSLSRGELVESFGTAYFYHCPVKSIHKSHWASIKYFA